MNFLTHFADKIDAGSVGVPQMDGQTLLTNGLNLTYFLAGTIAIIVIIIAGIMYVTSSGDAGKVAKAKNLLTYAIVGIVVVMVAFVVTSFVSGRFK